MAGISTSQLELDQAKVSRFRMDRVAVIVSGHLVQDTYSAFLAPLLPSLIEKLSLSYTQAGFLSAVTQLPSLLNPFIGYLDDKLNLRIFVILAPAVTATMMSLLGAAPTYSSLLLLLFITGLSIASFHSISPAMIARESGDQIGKGMSLFMAAGEMGRTIGPLVAAWALLTLTMGNMFPIAIFGWIASLIIFIRFRGIPIHVKKQNQLREALPAAGRLFLPLIAIMFFRSFMITGMGVYLPTLLQGQGASVWKADISLSIYQLAGVFGAFMGGTISDRFGRKPVLFLASLLAPILVLFFLNASGWIIIPTLILAGIFGLSSQPIMLAIVQDQLPGHRSVGNGLFMAINFICLSVAAVAIGMLADRVSLLQAFQVTAILGLIVLPFIFWLPAPLPNANGQSPEILG